MNYLKSWLTGLVCLVGVGASAWGYTFQLVGDQLTLAAFRTPLTNILSSFAHAGVKVQVDPELNPRISGTAVEMRVEEALEQILDPYGYVLVWDVVKGPLGDFPRLVELQVFRRGEAWRVQEFPAGDGNFRVARGPNPDSPEFIADEILLALRPGVSADAFRLLLSQVGGTIIESVPGLGIYRIRLPRGSNVPALVEQLRNQDMISRVEPNYVARLPDSLVREASAAFTPVAPPTRENAPLLAVLDSGLRAGYGLDDAVISRFDAVDPSRALDDTSGHGTQMALVASGAIAPDGSPGTDAGIPIMAIRAFDDNGVTSYFTMMRAIDHALDEGAKVMNLSWGSDTDSSFLRTTLQHATSKGMIVVASAGNEPTGRPVYPAAYPEVISVSALRSDGTPWERSNFGSTVTLAAPGTASMPVGYQGPPGNYAGTSIASAYVSHQVAQYLTAYPRANTRAVETALRAAVSPGAETRYGFGSLDSQAAQRLTGPSSR